MGERVSAALSAEDCIQDNDTLVCLQREMAVSHYTDLPARVKPTDAREYTYRAARTTVPRLRNRRRAVKE